MEQRQEIKNSVKEKMIEFMAEQISKEESFAELKQELIEEFLVTKKASHKVVQAPTESLSNILKSSKNPGGKSLSADDIFSLENLKSENPKDVVEKFKKDKLEKESKVLEKIIDLKTGKNPINLRNFMSDNMKEDSETYKQIVDLIEGNQLKEIYAKDNFTDYSLRYSYTEEQKVEMRARYLEIIKKTLATQLNNEFYNVEIKTFHNGPIQRKEYLLSNKIEKIIFNCSYLHNASTNETHIDSLIVDSAGFLIKNEDLGIEFAIQAMQAIDASEHFKKEAYDLVKQKTDELFKIDELFKVNNIEERPKEETKSLIDETLGN